MNINYTLKQHSNGQSLAKASNMSAAEFQKRKNLFNIADIKYCMFMISALIALKGCFFMQHYACANTDDFTLLIPLDPCSCMVQFY